MSKLHSARVLGTHRDEDCILCARWRREQKRKETDNGLRRYVLRQIDLTYEGDRPKWEYVLDLLDGKATYPR